MSKDKRPKIVKNFEVIELSILGLGIINSALQYDALTAISSPFFVMFVQTFTFFIMLWIILAITRQKSSFAKWLLVFSSAISFPIYIPLLSFAMHNSLVGLISIGQLVLTLVGLYYLFTPEFKMYLKSKKNHKISKIPLFVAFLVLFVIIFIDSNYVSNEVTKITEQPELKPIPQGFKPYEGEVIPLDETKRFDPDKPYTVLESKKGQYDVEGALNDGYSISQIDEHMKANNFNPINPDKKYNLDTFGFLIKEDIPIDETKQFQTPPSPKVVNNYGNLLRAHIAKYKKYPRIAQRRKIEGMVVIEIQIRGDGTLISKYIKKSSGHEILDKAAMNMIEKSKPFPVPPDTLKNSVKNVAVPIAFNLN